MIKLGLISRCN